MNECVESIYIYIYMHVYYILLHRYIYNVYVYIYIHVENYLRRWNCRIPNVNSQDSLCSLAPVASKLGFSPAKRFSTGLLGRTQQTTCSEAVKFLRWFLTAHMQTITAHHGAAKRKSFQTETEREDKEAWVCLMRRITGHHRKHMILPSI